MSLPTDNASLTDDPPCLGKNALPLKCAQPSSLPAGFPQIDHCRNCPIQKELSIQKCETGYWKKMHQKAVERETLIKKENEELKAKVNLREKQLFGRGSEKGNSESESPDKIKNPKKRRRGKQPNSKGHGRRKYDKLPAEPEIHDLPENQRCCPECGLESDLFPDTEDSEIIEVNVRAHRRIIKRKKYKPTCRCHRLPQIITAPAADRLIPKSRFGVSVWVSVLMDKFFSLRPTYRMLADLRTHGLDMAQGTITDGLKAIAPILDPSRAAEVPEQNFEGVVGGILVVDRYSAYKSMAKIIRIILAFCRAHVRRDFLTLGNNWPIHEEWALDWVEDIGTLYHLNHLRLSVIEQPHEFGEKDADLRASVSQMAEKLDEQLAGENLHFAKEKVLTSLKNHWEGLTVFVDHPEVPMDNNESERRERTPVLGRKNFYGSGSIWSGYLAAMMFSIFQTLSKYDINPRLWLTLYLEACAACGGKAPDDIEGFLPWKMSDQQLARLRIEPEVRDSS